VPGWSGAGREQSPVKPVRAGEAEAHCNHCAGGARKWWWVERGGEELKKEQHAGRHEEAVRAGATLGGGGETVGPSEISGDEDHISNPWSSAGKPLKIGVVERPLQLWPSPDPSEQLRLIAEGWITRMRCCSESYSHMLHVPARSALTKKQAAMAWVTVPFPCPVVLSPSDGHQWLVQKH